MQIKFLGCEVVRLLSCEVVVWLQPRAASKMGRGDAAKAASGDVFARVTEDKASGNFFVGGMEEKSGIFINFVGYCW